MSFNVSENKLILKDSLPLFLPLMSGVHSVCRLSLSLSCVFIMALSQSRATVTRQILSLTEP